MNAQAQPLGAVDAELWTCEHCGREYSAEDIAPNACTDDDCPQYDITTDNYFEITERYADMLAWLASYGPSYAYTDPDLQTLELRSDDLLYMVDDGWSLDRIMDRTGQRYHEQCDVVLMAAGYAEVAA